MKKAALHLTAIATISLLFVSLTFVVNDDQKQSSLDDKKEVVTNVVTSILKHIHFKPVELDNEFSEKAFHSYLDQMDHNKRFLIKEDIERLEKYKREIDNEIKVDKHELFDVSVEIINKRINDVEGFYKELLEEPFDYDVEESIQTDGDELSYAKDLDELKEYWRKYLKYQVLVRMYERELLQEEAEEGDTLVEMKSPEEVEAFAREKVMEDHENWFRRLNQLDDEDRFASYLNATLAVYDPHTSYFPPKDKENFDISISGRLEGIGATLKESKSYIEVTRIVPGSASWKQGELEAGDVILKVGQGKEDPVSVVGMRLDEAVQLIRGEKGTEVRLTVKKLDGNIKVIPIVRDIVVLEETYAKSALLKNKETGVKTGYIKLPKFYADFSGSGGPSSAEDVKKEVEKLKKEDVSGIIIDLRDNGGGSLRDVVEMAGLFIKEGPIVQVKTRRGDPYVLPDKDHSVQYDGNLVVLVNSLSASASEIFAAAMQDYERAVIMGSASTYGKGTVQRFEDLDQYLQDKDSLKKYLPLGSLKMTIQKFYRINGGATQQRGVKPDIVLPDNYAYVDIGERELDHAMPWDEISPVDYKKWGKLKSDMDKIQKKSEKRVENNETFQTIDENAKRYKRLDDISVYSLNREQFMADRKKRKEESEKYKNILEEIPDLHVDPLSIQVEEMESDSTKRERIETFHKQLKKDIYLFEAINVIDDMG